MLRAPHCRRVVRSLCARYLVFYDDCEFEWLALAGPGPDERVQFHRGRPEFQMITELNLRVRFMKVVTYGFVGEGVGGLDISVTGRPFSAFRSMLMRGSTVRQEKSGAQVFGTSGAS